MKTEIQALSEDIKEVKEKCLRKSDFERSVLQLESKVERADAVSDGEESIK